MTSHSTCVLSIGVFIVCILLLAKEETKFAYTEQNSNAIGFEDTKFRIPQSPMILLSTKITNKDI